MDLKSVKGAAQCLAAFESLADEYVSNGGKAVNAGRRATWHRVLLIGFLFVPPAQVFTPLVLKCKQLGRAMRIGTNHGSLSDRIMSYYGDSPRGMVRVSCLAIPLANPTWPSNGE